MAAPASTSRVLLIVFDGVQTLDVAGPGEVFANAGRAARRAVYQVSFLSAGGGERATGAGLPLRTGDLLRVRPRPEDTIVVAGGSEAAVAAAEADARLLGWLRRAGPIARRTTSVCTGAFVLAAAGLLDGRRAATHWSDCQRLAQRYPQVTVDPNAIFVTDGNVWTSAGVTTGIDMALAIVEEDLGRRVADTIAAHLVLYARRPGYQSQFSEALVAQTSGADPLGPAIAWARGNLRQADVAGLARRAGMSLRTLHRRCLALGTTPAKLIAKVRVEQARALLTASRLPVKTLAAQCGFGSAARLTRAFERELGMGPRAYRVLHAPAARGAR
ncbi:MAG TPA: DJ-1/PfpI family protein [Polyangia bacterium]|nr:DJ-1/PfpI family protein [Polyangia bacterium]